MRYDPDLPRRFVARAAELPDLSNAAVRVMCWLLALAEKSGSTELELFYTALEKGFDRKGVTIAGSDKLKRFTSRPAIKELEENGLLVDTEIKMAGFPVRQITLTVDKL